MKKSILFFVALIMLSFCSCSSELITIKTGLNPDKAWVVRYGDDRFHDDGQLIDEIYYVCGPDTVHVRTVNRKRNKKNYYNFK